MQSGIEDSVKEQLGQVVQEDRLRKESVVDPGEAEQKKFDENMELLE